MNSNRNRGSSELLVDELAERVHEMWMQARIDEGWTYGKQRDDHGLHHPCLVPYADLPEHERAIDRSVVRAVLEALDERDD